MVRSAKRKGNASESIQTAAKKGKEKSKAFNASKDLKEDDQNDNVFKCLLRSLDLLFKHNTILSTSGADQTSLQMKMLFKLKSHKDYPQVLDEFVQGFEYYILENSCFLSCLLPIENQGSDIIPVTNISQDSLAKLLMGIDILQPKMINCLLEKLPMLSTDDDTIRPRFQDQELYLPRLVVNQFRWLDRIVDGKEFVAKMFEVISVSELSIQREIIGCMPEVVDDSLHPDVCQRLREMLMHNSQLTTVIIEAFSNLNLQGTLLSEVRQSVLEILDSANLEDCPVAVKFILQSVTDDDCVEVIGELRARLDFGSSHIFGNPEFSSTAREKYDESKDHELVMLDIVQLALRFQKCVATGWAKTIESITDPSAMKILDFYVLIVMHGMYVKKKSVVSMLRQKIKSEVLTTELVEKAFCAYGKAFVGLYKDLLAISESLLRSSEVAASKYGSKVYEEVFVHLDTYCQQEVVAALITHIGSGLDIEIESALDVLHNLVSSHPEKMAPFAIFLKGILDYIDNLTTSQIRQLFSMASSVLVQTSSGESVLEDDVTILIRKHLSNSSIKYRRIGVIGAVKIAANMSKKRSGDVDAEIFDSSSSQTIHALNSGSFKEVISLLEMVNNCVKKDSEAVALYYDELSSAVASGELHASILHWISDNVVVFFQDEFLSNLENLDKGSNIELLYDLDGGEGGIALNLFQMILKEKANGNNGSSSSSTVSAASSIIYMSSLFRLIATCERRQRNGMLDGIDALLGCPIILFAMGNLERCSTLSTYDKELMCKTLFLAINWLREVINAFSTQSDPETKGKVLSRLETITSLTEILNTCLQNMPNFVPPQAIFDSEEVICLKVPKPAQVDRGKKKGRKRKAPEGPLNAEDITETEKEMSNEKETFSVEKTEEKNRLVPNFSWQQYRCFFRELDLRVFKILQYGIISKNILDTDMHTKETEVLSMKPKSLEFLLEDLYSKAAYALPPTTAVRKSLFKRKANKDVGFSNLSQVPRKQVAELMVDLIPSFCEQLEAHNSYFQDIHNKSDWVNDFANGESQIMSNNFHLILSCFYRLLSWERIRSPSLKSLLKKALWNVASRIKSMDEDNSETHVLLRETVHYFEELSSGASDLTNAVLIFKVITALGKFDETEDTKMTISKVADDFLKKEWSGDDCRSGSKFNESLAFIVKMRIDVSKKALIVLEEFVNILNGFLENNCHSASIPTLHRGTFQIFYKAIAEELPSVMKEDLLAENESENGQTEALLTTINGSIRIFNELISMVKVVDTRSVFGNALKNGRLFLEAFLKLGMPILDSALKKNKDEVHSILKSLQQSTRCLHHFCGHSKVSQDVTLTNHVPSTKKCLETFVFRVKAMLAFNSCHSAFWLGNLKNRDIHGNEILSQASVLDVGDEAEADCELIEKEITEGVEAVTDGEKDGDESCSESF